MSLINALLLVIAAGQSTTTRFAVIGDYGLASQPESDVAQLVDSFNPDLILTVGDNNYEVGAASSIDTNIGQYYHDYIFPYQGTFGPGATVNKFFPTLGNHDWGTPGAAPYLDYFALPGNERYYEFAQGSVRFFAIDSDTHEPDGTSPTSVQGQWLQSRLAAATEPWKVVYFHHAPYSSGDHGNSTYMQWPFAAWGASAVLAGHDHDYERLSVNGIPYFVNGVGGKSLYVFRTIQPQSQFRYNSDYGAMIVDATATTLDFKFYRRTGSALVDSLTVTKGTPTPPAAPTSLKGKAAKRKVLLTWVQSPSAGITQNKIYRGTAAAGPFASVATIGATTSYSDNNLTSGVTYYYHVTAVNGSGESGFSNQASATPK